MIGTVVGRPSEIFWRVQAQNVIINSVQSLIDGMCAQYLAGKQLIVDTSAHPFCTKYSTDGRLNDDPESTAFIRHVSRLATLERVELL